MQLHALPGKVMSQSPEVLLGFLIRMTLGVSSTRNLPLELVVLDLAISQLLILAKGEVSKSRYHGITHSRNPIYKRDQTQGGCTFARLYLSLLLSLGLTGLTGLLSFCLQWMRLLRSQLAFWYKEVVCRIPARWSVIRTPAFVK